MEQVAAGSLGAEGVRRAWVVEGLESWMLAAVSSNVGSGRQGPSGRSMRWCEITPGQMWRCKRYYP